VTKDFRGQKKKVLGVLWLTLADDCRWLGFGWTDYSLWRHLQNTVNKFWHVQTTVDGELWRQTVQGYDFDGGNIKCHVFEKNV